MEEWNGGGEEKVVYEGYMMHDEWWRCAMIIGSASGSISSLMRIEAFMKIS